MQRRSAWDVDNLLLDGFSLGTEHAIWSHPTRALLRFQVAQVRGALERRHLARGHQAQDPLHVLIGAGPLQIHRAQHAEQVALAVPAIPRKPNRPVDAASVRTDVGVDDVANLSGDPADRLDLKRRDHDGVAATIEHVVVVGIFEHLALARVR